MSPDSHPAAAAGYRSGPGPTYLGATAAHMATECLSLAELYVHAIAPSSHLQLDTSIAYIRQLVAL